mmetsp:Transcript_107343/g.308962  ORF Transcript_107343/g.308962 Transcript_107343/m.308962 type:complete len:342 (+) Transcript_107343:376-1401(+)
MRVARRGYLGLRPTARLHWQRGLGALPRRRRRRPLHRSPGGPPRLADGLDARQPAGAVRLARADRGRQGRHRLPVVRTPPRFCPRLEREGRAPRFRRPPRGASALRRGIPGGRRPSAEGPAGRRPHHGRLVGRGALRGVGAELDEVLDRRRRRVHAFVHGGHGHRGGPRGAGAGGTGARAGGGTVGSPQRQQLRAAAARAAARRVQDGLRSGGRIRRGVRGGVAGGDGFGYGSHCRRSGAGGDDERSADHGVGAGACLTMGCHRRMCALWSPPLPSAAGSPAAPAARFAPAHSAGGGAACGHCDASARRAPPAVTLRGLHAREFASPWLAQRGRRRRICGQ